MLSILKVPASSTRFVVSLTPWTNGTNVETSNLQDKTLVGYNSVPLSYSPLPPCLPPSVLLFQQQPHSSAPHAYTGASLCNAGSFLVFRSHKKKCRREGEMHMRRHQSMSCGTIGGFFFEVPRISHHTLVSVAGFLHSWCTGFIWAAKRVGNGTE